MATHADFTLEELFDRGQDALAQEDAGPGTTYELAPGAVGKMVYPTLGHRNAVHDAEEPLQELYKDPEDLSESVREKIADASPKEAAETIALNLYREDVSMREIRMTRQRVTCKQAVAVLGFGDEEMNPEDAIPSMAQVVGGHFRLMNQRMGKADDETADGEEPEEEVATEEA